MLIREKTDTRRVRQYLPLKNPSHWAFSIFEVQATYNKLNPTTGTLEKTLVTVENLFNYDGIKYIISNAAKNFISFTTLSTLLISLIGLSVAQATGFLDTFIKRVLVKIDNKKI